MKSHKCKTLLWVLNGLRSDLERRRRHVALERLLDRLAAEDGPLGPGDEPEIARFMRLLGGLQDDQGA